MPTGVTPSLGRVISLGANDRILSNVDFEKSSTVRLYSWPVVARDLDRLNPTFAILDLTLGYPKVTIGSIWVNMFMNLGERPGGL